MGYLLDSDAITFFYDDQRQPYHDALHRHVAALDDADSLETSSAVLCELEYSYFMAPDDKKQPIRRTIDSIQQDFGAILPVDEALAPVFGELKARLASDRNVGRKGMRKHNIDILLASSAIVAEAVLVGMDQIYDDVAQLHDGFRHESWMKTPK